MLQLIATNIKVNDSECFKMQVPEMFLGSADLLQTYLRTKLFDTDYLTFELLNIDDVLHDETYITTDNYITQPMAYELLHIYDDVLGPMKTVDVIGSCMSNMTVLLIDGVVNNFGEIQDEITEEDWLIHPDQVKEAVLEQLRNYLPVRFFVIHRK